jgi:glyoxylase-like metal-dependent hydrolase (beta-lactamase superfamily II)
MEIIDGVHVIDLGVVYAYLYQEADRLTLIDTGLGTSAERIVREIAAVGRRPSDLCQIVVTHYHADHAGSAEELAERTGAQVLVHALDAPVVRGESEEAPAMLSEIEREFYERITPGVPPCPPARVDRELSDGDEIELDGGARVVHAPGHTPGSIALYVPKRRLLFLGDAAARMPDGQLIVGAFNVDPEQTRASFRKLAQLEFDAAFFGHGAPLDKDASRAFRRLVERLGG